MIHFACQSCNKNLRIADTDAGKTRPCPKCRAMILIPQPADVSAVQEPERPVLPVPVPPTSGLDWRWAESTWPAASSVPISELDSDDPTEPDEDPFAADPFTEDIERLAAEVDREDAETAALARNQNQPAPKQANEPEPRQRGISLVAMFGISLFAVFFIGLPVLIIAVKSEFAEKVMRKLQATKEPEKPPADAGIFADAQERMEKEWRERGAQEKERERIQEERFQQERFQRTREIEQQSLDVMETTKKLDQAQADLRELTQQAANSSAQARDNLLAIIKIQRKELGQQRSDAERQRLSLKAQLNDVSNRPANRPGGGPISYDVVDNLRNKIQDVERRISTINSADNKLSAKEWELQGR
jgi:phage FluMu protein Com